MPKKLFVGNLPHEVTDTQLQEFIAAAGFQSSSAVVIRDKMTGQSRGFGFVELDEGEDMERAIAGLNGQSLQGRRLTVNEARPPRSDFGGGGGGGGRPHGGGGGGGGGGRNRGGGSGGGYGGGRGRRDD
jgi:cold-inducible RNA-binding protein